MTRASLSVVLAVAICSSISAAQAAPKVPFHPQYSIEELAKAIALASKEINAPPPKTMFKKVSDGLSLVAAPVGSLSVLIGTYVGICHWYHWYEWCDRGTNDRHHDHDHE